MLAASMVFRDPDGQQLDTRRCFDQELQPEAGNRRFFALKRRLGTPGGNR
jgi:hypothetical protein